MSADPLDRYRRRSSSLSPDEEAFKPGDHPIAPAWIGACLRVSGQAKPLSLVLRQRDGIRTALSYGYLSAVRHEPAGSVELEFVGHQASIKGRRLGDVFEALAAQSAMELAESTSITDSGDDRPFIETISIVATQEH